jgi:hypothetical protein
VIDAVILEGFDDKANALGLKALGELGKCGAGAAIGNAVFNATGIRARDFPIMLDKVLWFPTPSKASIPWWPSKTLLPEALTRLAAPSHVRCHRSYPCFPDATAFAALPVISSTAWVERTSRYPEDLGAQEASRTVRQQQCQRCHYFGHREGVKSLIRQR